MAASIFDIKAQIPDDHDVAIVLGSVKTVWDKLETHIFENYKDTKKDWKFYSKKSGWTLVFKKKDRTLLYFIPYKDYFKVWFVFGEKAVNEAKQASLPQYVIDTILAATSYVEGTSFGVDAKEDKDVETAITLLKIKDES